MRLAGHDFEVKEHWTFTGPEIEYTGKWTREHGHTGDRVPVKFSQLQECIRGEAGFKSLVRSDTGRAFGPTLNVASNSYGVIQNSVGWDVVDSIIGEGAKYETAGVLKGGEICWVLAWLDEPVTIPGDDSIILPYLNTTWYHNGTGALTARSTSVRVVCWNTQAAAESEGRRLKTDFIFRHTKNVMGRIEEAKKAISGLRDEHVKYVSLAEDYAKCKVTVEQRDEFVNRFIGYEEKPEISPRVQKNIQKARDAVTGILLGPTVPEAHKFTAYGLHLAGTEYIDHLRGTRAKEPRAALESKFKRSILRNEPQKAALHSLIKEVTHA
jgi:phage/plasmid-like protein (TIGR03299 family)